MIISCPNCNKKFKINSSLISVNGRDLKCGSCDHVWFFKIEDSKTEPLSLPDDFVDKEIEPNIDNKIIKNIDDKKDKNEDIISEKQANKKNTNSKFFSYLVVSIISLIALIILIDTLKVPLINVFPGLEIFLFNLFEILKDIKLFIIDLY